MTGKSDRRLRVLRLRSIEHRIAVMRLADADATLANLLRVRARLEKLRAGLGVDQGRTQGMDLLAMAELAQRLERAQAGITAPAHEAKRLREERQAERIKARRREDGASKLHIKAVNEDVVTQERRTDGNRQHIKRKLYLGVE